MTSMFPKYSIIFAINVNCRKIKIFNNKKNRIPPTTQVRGLTAQFIIERCSKNHLIIGRIH